MGFNAARGYPGQGDLRHGAARPVERKLGPSRATGRRTLEEALLHLLRASPEQADSCHETLPPAPGYRPAICLRRVLLPARCDRAGGPLVLRFGLSYRDVEELLAERGIQVDQVTVYRWVRRFPPLLAEAARRCRPRSGTAGRWTRPT